MAAEGACTANPVRPGRVEPWVPLLFTLFAAAVGLYQCPKRDDVARAIRDRLWQPRQGVAVPSDQQADGVMPAIGGTPGRILMMQVAASIGGMFARTCGDMPPWLILIELKTLFDHQRPDRSCASAIAPGRKDVKLPLLSDVFEDEVRQLDHKPSQPGVLLEQRQYGNVVTSI